MAKILSTGNGDGPVHTSIITIAFTPSTGQFSYKFTGCTFIEALGLLAMAKMHIFHDRLVAEWKARQKGGGKRE